MFPLKFLGNNPSCLSSFWWSQAFLCLWLQISVLRLHLSMATYPLCVSVAPSFLNLPLDLRSARNPVWYHLKSLHYICKDSIFKWFAFAQINLFDGHYGTHYRGWVLSEEVLSKEASRPWAESWGRISPGRRDGWRMPTGAQKEALWHRGGNQDRDLEAQGECIIYKKHHLSNKVKYPRKWGTFTGVSREVVFARTVSLVGLAFVLFCFSAWQSWWEREEPGAGISGSQCRHTICKLLTGIIHISSLRKTPVRTLSCSYTPSLMHT